MCWITRRREAWEGGNGLTEPKGFTLPRMLTLRGLNLYGAHFDGDGLENIPSVEVLCLSRTDVCDQSVPAILSLGKLRRLGLAATNTTESGISDLRRGKPNCEISGDR